jgi:hypothetical protein
VTTKTIDCVECGESVSYGRLSCPVCGALLASMAGGRTRRARTAKTTGAGDLEPAAADTTVTVAELEPVPANPPAEEGLAETAATDQPGAAAVEGETKPETANPAAEAGESVLEPAAYSLSPDPGAALPPRARTPFDGPEPILVARSYAHGADAAPGTAQGGVPASAYRPPALALSTATAAGPSWPATTMTVAARSSIAATDSAEADPATTPPDTGARATRLAEIGTWFVIVGAAMAVLGFLLPWSTVVIGSRSLGGYLDTWGLASPTHVVVLLATVAILGLGILRTTVPVWLWSGVLPLVLGGLLVGLTWPYQVGPLGADVGVIVVALGGLALVIGGVVTSWATRHVEVEPAV